MSSRWIEHNGKQILFTDFIGCDTEDKMISNLEEAGKIYTASPEKILGLYDLTGTTVTNKYMAAAKDMAKNIFNIKREKSAVIGITGIKKILLEAYNKKTGDSLIPFDTKEEALEYLTS